MPVRDTASPWASSGKRRSPSTRHMPCTHVILMKYLLPCSSPLWHHAQAHCVLGYLEGGPALVLLERGTHIPRTGKQFPGNIAPRLCWEMGYEDGVLLPVVPRGGGSVLLITFHMLVQDLTEKKLSPSGQTGCKCVSYRCKWLSYKELWVIADRMCD